VHREYVLVATRGRCKTIRILLVNSSHHYCVVVVVVVVVVVDAAQNAYWQQPKRDSTV
jgi:hypothetical protein